jgi:hypothetical protein
MYKHRFIHSIVGIYTGSVYNSGILIRSGEFPGEKYQDGRVLVIKTHQRNVTKFLRAVVIIRDPFDAILAEFNRQKASKTVAAPRIFFNTSGNDIL